MLMIQTVMLKIASENDYPITPLCVHTKSKYSSGRTRVYNISNMYYVINLRRCFISSGIGDDVITSCGNKMDKLLPVDMDRFSSL